MKIAVGDYRALNTEPIKDRHSITCHIDLSIVYHQIPMIFIKQRYAHLLDFSKAGVCNLVYATRLSHSRDSSTKSRVIYQFPMLSSMILITSKRFEEHYHHLKALFSKLEEYDLYINASKCTFG